MLKIVLAPLMGLIVAASAAQGDDQPGHIQQNRKMFTATLEHLADQVTMSLAGAIVSQRTGQDAQVQRGFEGMVVIANQGEITRGSVRTSPRGLPHGFVGFPVAEGMLIIGQPNGSLFRLVRESDASDLIQMYRVERYTSQEQSTQYATIRTAQDTSMDDLIWFFSSMTAENCGCSVCLWDCMDAANTACSPNGSKGVNWTCDPATGLNACSWTCHDRAPVPRDP